MAAPSFCNKLDSATQNAPKYRKTKGLYPPNSSASAKGATFSEMPLVSGFLAHVPRCDRPCCPFPAGFGKMYHEPSISAHWPDVKQSLFSGNHEKPQGRNVCGLKAGWLDATRRRTSPSKAERISQAVELICVYIKTYFHIQFAKI